MRPEIMDADVETLMEVPEIREKEARLIWDYLHRNVVD